MNAFLETSTNTYALRFEKGNEDSQTVEGARGAGYYLISRLQQSIVNKNIATLAVQGYSFEHSSRTE